MKGCYDIWDLKGNEFTALVKNVTLLFYSLILLLKIKLMHINLAWPDQFILDGFHWNWNNSFTAKVCLHASFFDVWTVVGRGKMQFKPVFYANPMYTVCHTLAYSSSRNIYCHVPSELHKFLFFFEEYLSHCKGTSEP